MRINFSKYLLRKRAQKGSPDVHFTNNAQMVYAHPALIRSSGSGLSAFCPTLFLCYVFDWNVLELYVE